MYEGIGTVRVDRANYEGIDPSLQSCCLREEESNRRQTALETTLKRHDRIALAERRSRQVITNMSWGNGCRCCYDPNLDGGEYSALIRLRAEREREQREQKQQQQQQQRVVIGSGDSKISTLNDADSDSDSDSDSEFDYLLDEDSPTSTTMQDERLIELKGLALERQGFYEHGYGVHRQVDSNKILRLAGIMVDSCGNSTSSSSGGGSGGKKVIDVGPPPPSFTVIHLFNSESMVSASLDLCLENIASDYPGTVFLRAKGGSVPELNNVDGTVGRALMKILGSSPSSSSSSSSSSLLRTGDTFHATTLLAVRKGDIIAGTVIDISRRGVRGEFVDDSTGEVDVSTVVGWLEHSGVLRDEIDVPYESLCGVREEEVALLENLRLLETSSKIGANVEEMNVYQCGVEGCSKTFRHEHVGICNKEQSGVLIKEDDITGIVS